MIALRYSPGAFLDARDPECATRNENTWIGLEEQSPPRRRMVIRQISGKIARRIVCDLRPGEMLGRGQKIGMIKFGSRTELIIPDGNDLEIKVAVGQKIRAGTTVMARYRRNDEARMTNDEARMTKDEARMTKRTKLQSYGLRHSDFVHFVISDFVISLAPNP